MGCSAIVNASNKVVIGNASVTTIGGYATWTNYSDRRLKENIVYSDDIGLDLIMKLRTASFNYIGDKNKRRRDGLIAQDVDEALNELGLDFSGLVIDGDEQKTMNLSYGEFTVPLINSVQELNDRVMELETEKAQLEERIKALEERLNIEQ